MQKLKHMEPRHVEVILAFVKKTGGSNSILFKTRWRCFAPILSDCLMDQ